MEPAGITAQQIGQHGRQVQRFPVDLYAQGQQPGAFALGQHELLHGALAHAQRAIHLLAQQLAGVGGDVQLPALHGHAFVRKAGLHHHAPAFGAQLWNLLGPEVAKVRLLRQRPHGAQCGGGCAVAPLQRVGVHRDQAQVPHAVHGVGLGSQVALHAQHRAAGVKQLLYGGWAGVEHRGRRRCVPGDGVGRRALSRMGGVRPVDLRQRHAVATRAQRALRAQAQQAVAPPQGHQGDARAKVARGNAGRGGWLCGVCGRRGTWRFVAQPCHHAGGVGIGQGRELLQRGGVRMAAQGCQPHCHGVFVHRGVLV